MLNIAGAGLGHCHRPQHPRNQQGGLTLLNALLPLPHTIIRGHTHHVVQLLIIYYVVLRLANVSKVLVAVVAFGLNSAAYLAESVRAGNSLIDRDRWRRGAAT
jgi:polar amino acid transport system substrate-binding protein